MRRSLPYLADAEVGILVSFMPEGVTDEEIANQIHDISQDESASRFDTLLIFERVDTGEFEDTNRLRRFSDLIKNLFGTGGEFKTAYVVDRQVDFGLINMFAAYRERDELNSSELFYNESDALLWLGLPEAQLSEWLTRIEAFKDELREEKNN